MARRRPATLVASFAQFYAFLIGSFLADSSPPPVFVDLPRISLAASFALIRRHPATAMGPREARPWAGYWAEEYDLALAMSSPTVAVIRDEECSSCAVCCPAVEAEIPKQEMLRGMKSVSESTHGGYTRSVASV